MRKPDFCLCEIKGADQLRSNCEHNTCDSATPLPLKSEIFKLLASSLAAQAGLCETWSETPKTGFLMSRLRYDDFKTKFLMVW